jgi:hypothetical protein
MRGENEMLKHIVKFIAYVFVALLLIPVTVSADRAVDLNLVVQMKGRGGFEFPPPNLAELLPDGAGGCFVTDLVDPKTGWTIGRGYDCILGAPNFIGVEGGFTIQTAYMLDFTGQGTLVSVNEITVQPTLDALPEETGITHVLGDFPVEHTIISGTRRFKKAKGSVRLSGGNDLRELNLDDLLNSFITFDYLFVISLEK